MDKKSLVMALLLFCMLPIISANTVIEIQTAPLKEVWITPQTIGGISLKVPEKYTSNTCGEVRIDSYEINESSFYLLLNIKEGNDFFFRKRYTTKFYKYQTINLTALPEGYNLNLPDECFEENNGEPFISENNTEELINTSEEIENNESLENSSTGLITGHAFIKEKVFTKDNWIYFVIVLLLGVIGFLTYNNIKKQAIITPHAKQHHHRNKNQKKIEELEDKIAKYEEEIIRLRREQFE